MTQAALPLRQPKWRGVRPFLPMMEDGSLPKLRRSMASSCTSPCTTAWRICWSTESLRPNTAPSAISSDDVRKAWSSFLFISISFFHLLIINI